ncbi:unnamed protein product, partial [Ectocarpus sp. 4 AP-2014]
MVQTGKTYEIFSADGTRLVRASNTKSSRCIKLFGYAWGGYALKFEGPCPSPPSAAAETQEDQGEDDGKQEQHGQHEEEQQEREEEREGPSASSPSSSAAAAEKTQEKHNER